ncbi:hypothetical protein BBF96_08110 [Anoxybacter fermentans]|uniref:Metalloprotease TldD/E C-terminal domain-containing protein n=1 Tax=Anoxybacter fermentans TaxID=1323375 RepID=A0A3S9SYL2_9FIRM|nr:TldD/PmbA family protein [Anoxybacter fermentans]AZR73348.1 hypothetical protein BBF96_08110 [Anoxybacter fermentans]
MLSNEDSKGLIYVMTSQGGEYADLFIENTNVKVLHLNNGNLVHVEDRVVNGIGYRLIKNGITHYAFTNKFEKDHLRKIAYDIALVGSFHSEPIAADFGSINQQDHLEQDFDFISLKKRIDCLKKLDKLIRDYYQMGSISLIIKFEEKEKNIKIVNCEDKVIRDQRNGIFIIVEATSSNQGRNYKTKVRRAFKNFTNLNNERVLKNLALAVVNRLTYVIKGVTCPQVEMPVVIGGEGGVLIHEACGHALEADLIQMGYKVFHNKLGEKVASDLVTIIDDGTLEGSIISSNYDDEGTKTRKNVLIKKGILQKYLTCRQTAKNLDMSLTGNGRRENFQYLPTPRMTNTYLQPNPDISPEEIIQSVKEGIYISALGTGNVNGMTGDFSFEVIEAFLIVDGKIFVPLKNMVIVGNSKDILQKIDMVGNDLNFTYGICNKFDRVLVSAGIPTLRISKIKVGGWK